MIPRLILIFLLQTPPQTIALTQGQYVEITVDPHGLDLLAQVIGSGNNVLDEADSHDAATLQLKVIAPATDSYRLEIQQRTQRPGATPYSVSISSPRAPSTRESDWVKAEAGLLELKRLTLNGTRVLPDLKKAIEIGPGILDQWQALGDKEGYAASLFYLARAQGNTTNVPKSIELLRQSIVIAESISDVYRQAIDWYTYGRVEEVFGGDLDQAIRSFANAGNCYIAVGLQGQAARSYSEMSSIYTDRGDVPNALEYYRRAESLAELAGDLQTRALAAVTMGKLYQGAGERRKAIEYYDRALADARTIGDPMLTDRAIMGAGLLYRYLQEPDRAAEYFAGDEPIYAGVAGAAYYEAGQPEKGELYTRRSIEGILTQKHGEDDPEINGMLGRAYAYLGDYKNALQYQQRALELMLPYGNVGEEIVCRISLAQAFSHLNRLSEAKEQYEVARDLSYRVGGLVRLNESLSGLADTERALGNLAAAISDSESALRVLENMRDAIPSEDLKASFQETVRNQYQSHIDLLMTLHRDADAFQTSERSRSRSLVELLAQAKVNVSQGIDPKLKQEETAELSKIAKLHSDLTRLYSQPKPDPAKVAADQEQLKQAELVRDEMELNIRKLHPRYADLEYPAPPKPADVQNLLDSKTALLEYAIGGKSGYLFVVTKEGVSVFTLTSVSDLPARVEKLRQALLQPRRATIATYIEQARALYRELVVPGRAKLTGKTKLIIAPDGALWSLPFEVLLQGGSAAVGEPDLRQLPYLIRDFSISYAPSAAVLAGLADTSKSVTPKRTLLAFGDPQYPVKSEFPSLPNSGAEVRSIAALFPANTTSIHLGADSNKASVKAAAEAADYRYIHFATHALIDPADPGHSGIVLSFPANSSEDGLLQTSEIFNMKLSAELAVLSACETGLGKPVSGEGFMGLTRAFFYAGVPSVVASLWKVDDRSTSDLMLRFYRGLLSPSTTKAEALRRAQLAMIAEGRFAHPSYWAPFILIGKP